MPDEKGQPLPGEWWGIRGKPVFYIVGYTASGEIVYQAISRQVFIGIHGWSKAAEHLPDCTGWDWKEPEWVPLDPETYGWHVLRKGVDQCKYKNDTHWQLVDKLAGRQINHSWYCCDYTFRCLRKDLPQKPAEVFKPDPGKGWRLLEPGELVIQGDEYFDVKWSESGNWKHMDGMQDKCPYRRRVEPTTVTHGGPYVSIDVHQKVVAERDALLKMMREIEAKAKFYESVF